MRLTIQFYSGLALRLAKAKEATVDLQPPVTLRHVAGALAEELPVLLGPLIAPETHELVQPHIFHVNGRPTTDLDTELHEGDRVWLLSITAGG